MAEIDILETIPKIRMLMMEAHGAGVLRLTEGAAAVGQGLCSCRSPEELRDIKPLPEKVYLKDAGLLEFTSNPTGKRLDQKIAVVTGSAQGFGRGIAEEMAKNGAYVMIADLNAELARKSSEEINAICGAGVTAAVKVDVSDEASVINMYEETVRRFGGLDILVSNAGVLKAGSLDEMDVKSFEFVTKVNYTAYFICVKHASRVMRAQYAMNTAYYTDIIQINSKSGLEGSNKNFAYAGGKFGGVGLTQSFAKELVPYNIKVNAICPGNLLGGPLWTDPEKGLFVQYLRAGKVKGAQTVDDVRKYYESRVPMGRGCEIIDVARAIYYVVEQQYETGQAIPVTGGQVMLS